MSSPGKFIISFDCEGKWGSADHIGEHHCKMHTNENLNAAYQELVNVLDKRQIKATFAFVAAFAMSSKEFEANPSRFKDVTINGDNWLSRFRQDFSNQLYDGWFNPKSLEIVQHSGKHEIGSHGFSHLPLSEELISQESFCHEMSAAREFAQAKNLSFKTLVYPRNMKGFTNKLQNFGFIGYREALFPKASKMTKILGLLNEINILQKSQEDGNVNDNVFVIPPGYFLNWRAHIRKKIPIALSLMRWKSIIRDAAKNGKVVHIWSHPHNFIDGDRQIELLEGILDIAAVEIAQGNLLNLTQEEYCLQHMNKS